MTPDDTAFDMEHLVDTGTNHGWPTRSTRVYLARCPWEDGSPWFTCHRLADGLLVGAGETKEDVLFEARCRLQRLPQAQEER